MKKFLASIVFATSIFSLSAQPGAGPGASSNFTTALMKLFGKNTAFSATADVDMDQGGKKTIMKMKMAYLDGKVRSDLDLADMKSADMPPEAIGQMKQMGMDKMATIIEPTKKSMVMIYPGLKGYAEMPLPAEQAESMDKEPKIDKQELGKETVDGHPCVKNKVTVTTDGKAQEFILWAATDLKDFPVKTEFNESGAKITVVYKDIQLNKPDASLFQPPAAFKKYNSMQEMMMEKMLQQQRQ
jgi:hypothetical protein